ncbi:MAG: polysaccharide biosynthesis/export family protein [Gammaproteobacteria bacterium]|nr:polysaccharide biosynthesis/export family protein [Gammaproteobacteria bacterium]
MKLSVFRALIAILLLLAAATASAQSAISDQFMNMNPAEREQLMRQFGLSPDDVLGAIRQGAGRAGAAAGAGQSGGDPQQGRSQDDGLESQQSGFGGMQGFPYLPQQERGPVYDPNDMSLSGSIDYADRYGLEVFSGGNARVQELYSIPVPGDYIVGPGDRFLVSLYGAESMQHYLPVTRDGWIDFPALGPIRVAGLPLDEAREVIAARVQEHKIGVSVSATLDQLKAVQVSVSGEVHRPGVYVVPSLASMVQVLSLAGGITDVGAMREVTILRDGERIRVDLYEYLLGGEHGGVMRLGSGDSIHVPAVRAAVAHEGWGATSGGIRGPPRRDPGGPRRHGRWLQSGCRAPEGCAAPIPPGRPSGNRRREPAGCRGGGAEAPRRHDRPGTRAPRNSMPR